LSTLRFLLASAQALASSLTRAAAIAGAACSLAHAFRGVRSTSSIGTASSSRWPAFRGSAFGSSRSSRRLDFPALRFLLASTQALASSLTRAAAIAGAACSLANAFGGVHLLSQQQLTH